MGNDESEDLLESRTMRPDTASFFNDSDIFAVAVYKNSRFLHQNDGYPQSTPTSTHPSLPYPTKLENLTLSLLRQL